MAFLHAVAPNAGLSTLCHHTRLFCHAVGGGGPSSSGLDNSYGDSSSASNLRTQQPVAETIQTFNLTEKGSVANSTNVMKLFNDVQQNMLYLNKQRVTAVEELEKTEREKELLIARIHLLEAEADANEAEREVLQRQLEVLRGKTGDKRAYSDRRFSEWMAEQHTVFSELLLRLGSMVLTGAIAPSQAGLLKNLVLDKDTQAARVFCSLQMKDDKEMASGLLPLLDPNRRCGLHIMHLCTELDPVVRGGTVGTSIFNLSHALKNRGNLVEVILPKYATISLDEVQCLREIQVDLHSQYGGSWYRNKIWTGVVQGIPVTFIESLHPGAFFLRDHVYDYSDDFERFSYFCRAALEYIVKSGKQPDILHLHNWQTALAAPLFWDVFVGQGLAATRIVFTCYNFKDQCVQEPAKLSLCGLDPERLHRADRLQDNLQPGRVNILKGGIVYSNKVTTVSPVYTLDVMTREQGHGLESTLMTHRNKFVGIYNGLDMSIWDPSTDPLLPAVYSFEHMSGKAICKSHLKQKLGFENLDNSTPLIGCVARKFTEADLELIKGALNCTWERGSQFIFMGGSDDPRAQTAIENVRSEFEERGARAVFEYDDGMAHLVLAASDILVCLSVNDEPTLPLIAMQYGSVPVTKQQKGSDEIIIDADITTRWGEANAYVFRSATVHELLGALTRAIDCMRANPQRWNNLVRNGMKKDLSWDAECVDEYIAAYWSVKQL